MLDKKSDEQKAQKQKMLQFIKQEKKVVVDMDRKEIMDGVKAVKKGKTEQPVPEQLAPIAHKIQKKI